MSGVGGRRRRAGPVARRPKERLEAGPTGYCWSPESELMGAPWGAASGPQLDWGQLPS